MVARFDDGKDQGALRTIGEVAQALGIKQHVLRYWEQQFPMLQPLKRSGGRRYYRPHDVALVEAINRLVNQEGYTLKGAKKALSQKSPMSDAESIPMTDPAAPEPTTPPSASAPGGFPFASELPEDGGLDAFFGTARAAAPTGSDVAHEALQPDLPLAARESAPARDQAELVAALKAIRARLASALSA